jgi:hypothetical protein
LRLIIFLVVFGLLNYAGLLKSDEDNILKEIRIL